MNHSELLKRVRKLATSNKLTKQLPGEDHVGLPWSEWAWVTSWFAYVGAAIALSIFALEDRPPDTEADLNHPSFYAAVALVLFGAATWFVSKVTVPRTLRRRRRLAKRGVIMPAAIVMANSNWYRPDNEEEWWAAILLTFDPVAVEQPDRLLNVAHEIAELKFVDRRDLPEQHVELAWSLYCELCPLRTRPVPEGLSGGLRDCFVADVKLAPRVLEHDGLLVALTVPGDLDADAVAVLPAGT